LQGRPGAPPSLLAPTREPRHRPGHLEPGPPPGALGTALPPTGATPRLASIGVCGARPDRTPPAARPGTARARACLACAPGGRRPAGSAWWALPGGRPQGGSTRRPHPLREPKSPEAMLGLGPCGLCLGCAAPAGGHDHSRADPCPPGSGRRRLGVPLSRQGQATSPTAPRHPPPDAPGHQLASPRQAGPTLPPPCGPRPTGAPRHRRHGPCAGGLPVGHGHPGSRRSVRLQDRVPRPPQRRRGPTCLRRGAAPVGGNPRQRSAACNGYACLERGRPPTAARKGGANPRRAAGSTVVSAWLRLCRCTEDKKQPDDLKKKLLANSKST
jgi:hypothetical protein